MKKISEYMEAGWKVAVPSSGAALRTNGAGGVCACAVGAVYLGFALEHGVTPEAIFIAADEYEGLISANSRMQKAVFDAMPTAGARFEFNSLKSELESVESLLFKQRQSHIADLFDSKQIDKDGALALVRELEA